MTPFTVDIPVRFHHTDPARIVFYPRYFEMLNQVVEDWFADGLGVDFRTLHEVRDLGVPTVHLDARFVRPSRLGDVLTFALAVTRLGRSRISLAVRVRCGEEERWSGEVMLAMVRLSELRSVEIPPDLRAGMEGYVAAGEAQA